MAAQPPALTTITIPQPEAQTRALDQAQPLPLPGYLQENELSQECRDLIASLPIEKGWVVNHLHQYQGFWHSTRVLQGILTCQNHFQARHTDIFLVTNPKSGATWLKSIMFSLKNRVHFPHPTKHHPLLTTNPHVLVPFIENEYIDNPLPDFNNFASPRLLATHLASVSLPKSVEDKGCKLVYLCRNPKDAFVSLWHFTNRLRANHKAQNSLEETFDKFCRGVSLYGPFWDHVMGYWKLSLESPQRVMFLTYEEIKKEPKVQVRRISEFLGCPFSEEEENNGAVDEILKLCSFEKLSNLEVNKTGRLVSGEEHQSFFRRGGVGDWMNFLTEQMAARMDQITEQKFSGTGIRL